MKKSVVLLLSIAFLFASFRADAVAAVVLDGDSFAEINVTNEVMLAQMVSSNYQEYIKAEEKYQERLEAFAVLLNKEILSNNPRSIGRDGEVAALEENISGLVHSRMINYPNSVDFSELSDAELLIRNVRLLFDALAWDLECSEDFDYKVFMETPNHLPVGVEFFIDYTRYQKAILAADSEETRVDNNVAVLDCLIDNNCATVNIRVDNYYLYEIGLVGHTLSEYEIAFRCTEGAWLISDMHSNIPLEDEYRSYYGETADSLLERENFFENETVQGNELLTNNSAVSISQTNTTSSIFYDRSKVVWYASEYALSYNDNFPNSTNDCMNFASQCVWYGFGGVNSRTYIDNFSSPMVASGTKAWYCSKGNGTSNSWTSISHFNSMVQSAGEGLHANYYSGVSMAQAGDLILISTDNQSWPHAYVVVAVTGTYGSRTTSDIYVSAHTTACDCVKLSQDAPNYGYQRTLVPYYV